MGGATSEPCAGGGLAAIFQTKRYQPRPFKLSHTKCLASSQLEPEDLEQFGICSLQ